MSVNYYHEGFFIWDSMADSLICHVGNETSRCDLPTLGQVQLVCVRQSLLNTYSQVWEGSGVGENDQNILLSILYFEFFKEIRKALPR